MKNFLSSLVLFFTASSSQAQTSAESPTNLMDQKAILVFYSRPGENYGVGVVKEGNTKRLAEIIGKRTGTETVEITSPHEYPKGYRATTDQVKKELADGYRPPVNPVKDISDYDLIILGYPIWWGEVPPPMKTWLESVNWKGKTILPFATHEGSRFGSSLENLRDLAKGAVIKAGLTVYGHDAQNPNEKTLKAIDNWLRKIILFIKD